jgi:hypothetical protein
MSGFKVFSTDQDLDDLFLPRGALDPSTTLVNYITPSRQNLSERYLSYSSGRKAPATGFKLYDPLNLSNNIDLSELFAYNYYGFGVERSDPASVNIRTSIVSGTEYVAVTFNSLSNQYYYKQGNSTANAQYTAGTFIVKDASKIADAKVIVVSGGGGGGAGYPSGNNITSASGGGGGAVHFLDISFVSSTRFLVEVGNGGVGSIRGNTASNFTRFPASRGGNSKITVTKEYATIGSTAYTTNGFFDASNNGTMFFGLDALTGSDIASCCGAGSGGGGGAFTNYGAGLKIGGIGSPGSNGTSGQAGVIRHDRTQCGGGGGGGGNNAPANGRTVQSTGDNPAIFSGDGGGAVGVLIGTTGFGSTYYGGGGGGAQTGAITQVTADSGFLMQGNGGLGGGGTAFRTTTGTTGVQYGGSGINGTGGGGGAISSAIIMPWQRYGGNGGHGTVIFTFRVVQ